MKYSIIIPVYNRPDEIAELLGSLSNLSPAVYSANVDAVNPVGSKDVFEVIVVEDGSTKTCESVVSSYSNVLNLKYVTKPNGGPGPARNRGAEEASGEWLIFLDSDTIVPSGWLNAIDSYLTVETGPTPTTPATPNKDSADSATDKPATHNAIMVTSDKGTLAAFGGPDRASAGFTPMQKAISYAMTSFFTTGGIRGGKRKITRFFPRSFNMGIRADVFRKMGGFAQMRFGEDMDLSMRIVEAGYKTALIPEAWLFHKRRTDLAKFYRQVNNSGRARIALSRRHPGSLKPVHVFPLLFVIVSVLCWPFDCFYALLILIDSTVAEINGGSRFDSDGKAHDNETDEQNGMADNGASSNSTDSTDNALSNVQNELTRLEEKVKETYTESDFGALVNAIYVGILSVAAAYVQLWGYGLGFLMAALSNEPAVTANVDNDKFYK